MQERNTDWLPPVHTQTWEYMHQDQETCNLGMCPDWGSNPQPLVIGRSSNQLSCTSQGCSAFQPRAFKRYVDLREHMCNLQLDSRSWITLKGILLKRSYLDC